MGTQRHTRSLPERKPEYWKKDFDREEGLNNR